MSEILAFFPNDIVMLSVSWGKFTDSRVDENVLFLGSYQQRLEGRFVLYPLVLPKYKEALIESEISISQEFDVYYGQLKVSLARFPVGAIKYRACNNDFRENETVTIGRSEIAFSGNQERVVTAGSLGSSE